MWGNGILGMFRYPTKMGFLNQADEVKIGRNFGVMSREGRVMVWGCNGWG